MSGKAGCNVGMIEGNKVGIQVVVLRLGINEGCSVGPILGPTEGLTLGITVG